MSQNLISINFSNEELQEIKNAINVLKTKLSSKLKTLSTADRVELLKMGDKTVAFVDKCQQYCNENPELIPPFLDVTEFKSDVFNYILELYKKEKFNKTNILSSSLHNYPVLLLNRYNLPKENYREDQISFFKISTDNNFLDKYKNMYYEYYRIT